jgi:hypothetical protein
MDKAREAVAAATAANKDLFEVRSKLLRQQQQDSSSKKETARADAAGLPLPQIHISKPLFVQHNFQLVLTCKSSRAAREQPCCATARL